MAVENRRDLDVLVTCKIHGLTATGRMSPNSFVVCAGSQAVLKHRASAHIYHWVVNARERLLATGVLKAEGDCLRFTRDTEFASPSTAAAVVVGGATSGKTAWKNSAGKNLNEMATKKLNDFVTQSALSD